MKFFITTLLLYLWSNTATAQTEKDFKDSLDFILENFNEKRTTKIYNKFNSVLKNTIEESSFRSTMDNVYTENGNMLSYELIMEEEKEKNYLVEFENTSMLLLVSLTKEGEIASFKIKEY